MSRHRDEHFDLCAAFVVGALDEADRLELETHRAEGCPLCEAEIARLAAALPALAASAPSAATPERVRGRVLEAVAREPREGGAAQRPILTLEPRRRALTPAWGWAIAAALLAVATFAVWRTNERLSRAVASNQREITQLESRLEEAKRWAALLDSPQAKVVDLALTPAGTATMRARATFDPASGRAVIVFENLAVPSGSDYELWAIRAAGPESLGLIRPDGSGRAVVRLDRLSDPAGLTAFAVSLERAGGSRRSNAPEGPVVMVGKLSG